MSADRITLKSEFAHVTVGLDRSGRGPRLEIRDELGGLTRYVDPLELECLTRADTTLLDRYLPYEHAHPDVPA